MTNYLIRRLIQMLLVVIFSSFAIYLLLWLAPILVLLGAIAVSVRSLRGRAVSPAASGAALSPAEEERLRQILANPDKQ